MQPSSVKFYFGGPESNNFERSQCCFQMNQDQHWEWFTRWMERHATA